jgi:hypothetical protein|tara:strand:- start:1484 stop:1609 length:126 start_codon:yes stop_codon:yes gene_type:complete
MKDEDGFDRDIYKAWMSYREAVESDIAAAILVLAGMLKEGI